MENHWVTFIIVALLLLLSAFFSSSETALFAMDEMRLKKLKDKNARKSIKLLLKSSSLLLITILFGSTAINTAVSSILGGNLFTKNPLYSTIAVTAIMLFFADISPKTIAILRIEAIAVLNSRILYPLYLVLRPVTKLIDSFVNGFVRIITRLHKKDTE